MDIVNIAYFVNPDKKFRDGNISPLVDLVPDCHA